LAAINPEEFRKAFLIWVRGILQELGISTPAANLGAGFSLEGSLAGGAEFGSRETTVDQSRQVRVNNGQWSEPVTDSNHDVHPYAAPTTALGVDVCYRGTVCATAGGKVVVNGSEPTVKPYAGLAVKF